LPIEVSVDKLSIWAFWGRWIGSGSLKGAHSSCAPFLVGGLGWAFIMSPVSWKTDLVLLFADFLCTRGHAYLLGHPPLYIIIRRWRISLSLSLSFVFVGL
jgi:hypothetical protein